MSELERRWRELGEYIREQRHLSHLSLRKLSELAGVSNPYLSQIERGQRKPSAEVLQQIARALEISPESLYVRAGILEAREDQDLVADIRRDTHLTHDQKQTLVRIYESFVRENSHLRLAREQPAAAAAPGFGASDDFPAPADAVDQGNSTDSINPESVVAH